MREEPPHNARVSEPKAGGGILIFVAKATFIAFGFLNYALMPRVLGEAGYGIVSTVFAVASLINNVIITASVQGVSYLVAQAQDADRPAVHAAALRFHGLLAAALAGLFAASSPFVAAFLRAPHLQAPLATVSLVVFFYGVYAPFVGVLNGSRRFRPQALLDMSYSLLRLVTVLGGAWVAIRLGTAGFNGAVWGFVAAAALILIPASSVAGFGKSGSGTFNLKKYASFLVPILASQLALSFLMRTDLLLLRRFLGAAAPSVADADALIGVYAGVQLFSFLPYQLLMALSVVLFPMLASAKRDNNTALIQQYTRGGVRVALLLMGAFCGVIAGLAHQLMRLQFSAAFAEMGAPALRILSLGFGTLAVTGISASALASLGRPKSAATLMALGVVLVGAGEWLYVRPADYGTGMLTRSAIATSIALLIVAVLAATLLFREARAFSSVGTALRVGFALTATILLGSRMPWGGLVMIPVFAGILALAYLLALVVLGELKRTDLGRLRALIKY